MTPIAPVRPHDLADDVTTLVRWARQQQTDAVVQQRSNEHKRCDVWLEENYFIPPLAGQQRPRRIVLRMHQKVILYLFFEEVVAQALFGEPSAQTCVYSTIKKSGKTCIAGGVGRWATETWGQHGEVYALANDEEQARGRIYAAAISSIELDPRYSRKIKGIQDLWRVIDSHATYLPTHSTLKAVSSDYKGEAGSSPVLTLWSELWGYCVSQDTEVLTERGWILAPDVYETDALAALLPDGTMRYEVPSAYSAFRMEEPMVRFQHRRGDFLVTPNHQVYGRYIKNSRDKTKATERGWWLERADDLADGRYSIGWLRADCAGLNGETEATQEQIDKAKLLGYYIAEGNILWYSYKEHREPTGIAIAQDYEINEATFRDIEEVIHAIDFEGETYITANGGGWTVKNRKLAQELAVLGKSHEKYVPDWIKFGPVSVQRAFLMAYLAGDGWLAGVNGYQLETTSKRLADDLMQVALHVGYVPRFMGSRKRGLRRNRVFRVSLSTGPIAWERVNSHWSREDYSGNVYCPTLEYGVFYIRRNGKCCWTGNSSEASKRLYSELTPVPTRARSMRYVETYAGYENESGILNDLEDRIKDPRSGSRQLDLDELRQLLAGSGLEWPAEYSADPLPLYVHPQSRTVAYWDQGATARKMPWQTSAYYSAQAAELTDSQFKRLHHNVRISQTNQFIDPQWWLRLHDPSMPALFDADGNALSDEPVVIAVDGSVSGDCSAAAILSRDRKHPGKLWHRGGEVWQPSGGPLDYGVTIKPALRRWTTGHIHPWYESCDSHSKLAELGPCKPVKPLNVVQLAYDPYQLHDMMTELRNEGAAWCFSFGQQMDRSRADKQLFDLIRDQNIHHVGDVRMADHLNDCAAKIPVGDNSRLRLVKKGDKSKIDYAVCLSMGSHEALRLALV